MATTTEYLSGTIATLASTELNSLANNALVAASSTYSNSSGYLLGECELYVTFGTAPTTNTSVNVYFLRAIDGTDYEDGSSSVTPARIPDVVFPLRAVTTAQRVTKRVAIPPGTFQPLIQNASTGQSFASSGNTLKILPLTYQNV